MEQTHDKNVKQKIYFIHTKKMSVGSSYTAAAACNKT